MLTWLRICERESQLWLAVAAAPVVAGHQVHSNHSSPAGEHWNRLWGATNGYAYMSWNAAHTPEVLGDQLSCDKVGQPERENRDTQQIRQSLDKVVIMHFRGQRWVVAPSMLHCSYWLSGCYGNIFRRAILIIHLCCWLIWLAWIWNHNEV